MLPVYVEWEWWLRWYTIINITDEGTFGDDQVPDDYGGPILKVEQNFTLFMVTHAGYMNRMEVSVGREKILDKTRKSGCGFSIEPFEELLAYDQVEPTGESTTYLPVYMQERPGVTFTEDEKKIYRELLTATIANA